MGNFNLSPATAERDGIQLGLGRQWLLLTKINTQLSLSLTLILQIASS
jgi:hypothetical protein